MEHEFKSEFGPLLAGVRGRGKRGRRGRMGTVRGRRVVRRGKKGRGRRRSRGRGGGGGEKLPLIEVLQCARQFT